MPLVGPALSACLALVTATAPFDPPPQPKSQPPAPHQPPPGRIVEFDRGIKIDWSVPQVELDAAVVLNDGYLELFACSGDAKAHESIIRTEARPQRVFMAMGLIGLTPGRPAQWNEQRQAAEPATGDPVELRVRFSDRGQQPREVPAHEWMTDLRSGRPLARARWIFCGSRRLKDGTFGADIDGVLAATVDFPTALIVLADASSQVTAASGPAATSMPAAPNRDAPTRDASNRDAPKGNPPAASKPASSKADPAPPPDDVHVSTADELQAGARPDRVPPIGTRVTLIIRAADATLRRQPDRNGGRPVGDEQHPPARK